MQPSTDGDVWQVDMSGVGPQTVPRIGQPIIKTGGRLSHRKKLYKFRGYPANVQLKALLVEAMAQAALEVGGEARLLWPLWRREQGWRRRRP